MILGFTTVLGGYIYTLSHTFTPELRNVISTPTASIRHPRASTQGITNIRVVTAIFCARYLALDEENPSHDQPTLVVYRQRVRGGVHDERDLRQRGRSTWPEFVSCGSALRRVPATRRLSSSARVASNHMLFSSSVRLITALTPTAVGVWIPKGVACASTLSTVAFAWVWIKFDPSAFVVFMIVGGVRLVQPVLVCNQNDIPTTILQLGRVLWMWTTPDIGVLARLMPPSSNTVHAWVNLQQYSVYAL